MSPHAFAIFSLGYTLCIFFMLHLGSSYRRDRRVFLCGVLIIFVYTRLYLHQNKYETLHKL